jgi:aryl-alcohol dehydrogenase-like predicted oxidoreductase
MDRPGTVSRRRLGSSRFEVSAIALGSWRTFERLPRERGLEILRHAHERTINLLDEARYDDETGAAPLPTGYSEVLFGELFRASGYPRDETIVSEKLWWEHWPQESAAAELDASLARLRFEHVDLIYCVTLPPALSVEQAVVEVGELLASGRARAWGVANWTAQQLQAAAVTAAAAGIEAPCAVQLPYSIVNRGHVEDVEMMQALRSCGAGVVASAVLEGGLLTGKYDTEEGAGGRMAGAHDDPRTQAALEAGRGLRSLANEWGTSAAALAIAFVLDHPAVASVLVGATSPAQLDEILAGVALHAALEEDQRSRLHAVGATGA